MTQVITNARKRLPRSLRLLLIDDNPHDRELLTRELAKHFAPLEVIPVRDAYELKRAVTYDAFDAAIIDYQLHWATGVDVLRRIKRARRDCPVLMFTASGNEEVAAQAMKEGLDDYITKSPKHYARLPFALEACLERAEQERQLAQFRSDNQSLSERMSDGERRLQFALEAVGMISWELNPATGQLTLSPNAESLLGAHWTSMEQAIAAANPSDVAKVRAAYAAAAAAGQPFVCDIRTVNPETQCEICLEVRGHTVRNPRGTVIAVTGVATDVTSRRNDERARSHLAAIVQCSDDAIFSLAPDATVLSWNDGAARLFGYAPDEMIGQSVTRLIPPDFSARWQGFFARAAAGEHVGPYEAVRLARGGRRIDVSVRLSPLFDREGHIVGISKIARDITERKQAEEARRLAEQRKDTFLAILAHELRNPLAPMRYATRLLEPGVPEQMAADARRMIDRQLAQMARLLDDLLDVSRITRGALEIKHEVLDLRDVIEAAVGSARPLAQVANQDLAVQVPSNPLSVSGDAVRLTQVIGNLLSNAVKFTPPNGRIALSADTENEEVIVRVQDNGVGIEPEAITTVFDLFVQLDPAGARATGGLGIGLSLARDLIAMHGGRIEAHSAGRGLGSEFVIRLPQTKEKPAITESVAKPERVKAFGASGVRILIVDDNVDAATSLSYVLTMAGYETTIVHEGNRAVEEARRLRPAVVLLDIGLPGLSGHEIARLLRAEPWGKEVQLIAITGWGQESDRLKSLDAGFDEHLTKPIDPEMLLQQITRAVRTVA